MKFDIEKSRLSFKSQFKESKWDDRGHSLIWDFTVQQLLFPFAAAQ